MNNLKFTNGPTDLAPIIHGMLIDVWEKSFSCQ